MKNLLLLLDIPLSNISMLHWIQNVNATKFMH